jgi:hypothetical protein
MNFNLKKLQSHFGIHKKEVAGFFLILMHMESGDVLRTRLGGIKKLDKNTFKLDQTKTIQELAEIWTDEIKNPIDSLFD